MAIQTIAQEADSALHFALRHARVCLCAAEIRTEAMAQWLRTAMNLGVSAHSFACSSLLASLVCSAALICLLSRSLTHSRARGKVNDYCWEIKLFWTIVRRSRQLGASAPNGVHELRIRKKNSSICRKSNRRRCTRVPLGAGSRGEVDKGGKMGAGSRGWVGRRSEERGTQETVAEEEGEAATKAPGGEIKKMEW